MTRGTRRRRVPRVIKALQESGIKLKGKNNKKVSPEFAAEVVMNPVAGMSYMGHKRYASTIQRVRVPRGSSILSRNRREEGGRVRDAVVQFFVEETLNSTSKLRSQLKLTSTTDRSRVSRCPAGIQLRSASGAARSAPASSLPPAGSVRAAMHAARTENELKTA